MAQVVVEHLSKVFAGPRGEPIVAVDDLSLSVADGELMILAGPSGCGKTTTLRLVAGLDEPTGGEVSIGGQAMRGVAAKHRDIAMVFQQPALYPEMSVRENLDFGLKLRKLGKAEIERRVGAAAEMLGLSDCLERRPAELSGGQRQRVALGRAMVRQPKVFLFDEPLSNLDGPMRAQMREEISRLQDRLGATMIYVTHDQAEAMLLGQRLAVMRNGRIQQVDKPLNVYAQPANQFVAGFIGAPAMNFILGTLVAQDGKLLFQELCGRPAGRPEFRVPVEPAVAARLNGCGRKTLVLGIRPEEIAVELDGVVGEPHAGTVPAVAEAVEALGAETHVRVMTGAHRLIVRVPGTLPRGCPQKVGLILDIAKARFFDPVNGQAVGYAC